DVIWLLLGCFVGTFLMGSFYGLVTTLNYGVIGAVIGIGIVKKWPYWQRLLNAAIVSVISFPITTYVLTGLNVQESMKQVIDELFAMMESMTQMLPESSVEVLNHFQNMMSMMMTTLLPTILILVGLMSAFLSDKVATLVLRRMNFEVPKGEDVQEFQLGSKLAIILLVSQILVSFITNHTLSVILLNTVMLLNTLFLFQGAIVMMAYFKSRNQKGIGIVLLVFSLMSSLSMFISVLGISDALFNYRERFAIKKT
ncbi:MAG: DUF2232 domain-containing protein, partial [Turicibacter sp.]|nr:DUF2232 domain-containing protein [Turicibacter sp.]